MWSTSVSDAYKQAGGPASKGAPRKALLQVVTEAGLMSPEVQALVEMVTEGFSTLEVSFVEGILAMEPTGCLNKGQQRQSQ